MEHGWPATRMGQQAWEVLGPGPPPATSTQAASTAYRGLRAADQDLGSHSGLASSGTGTVGYRTGTRSRAPSYPEISVRLTRRPLLASVPRPPGGAIGGQREGEAKGAWGPSASLGCTPRPHRAPIGPRPPRHPRGRAISSFPQAKWAKKGLGGSGEGRG